MNEMLDYIVVISAVFAFSLACSITRKGFSTNIFLTCVPISISILVWQQVLPFVALVIGVIIIFLMLFGNKEEDSGE